MQRKSLAFIVLLFVFLLLCATARPAPARRLDAKTIKAGLRTARPDENRFVDDALALVKQGKLASKLVYSTFQWARKKPRRKYQYFKKALRLRAARIGVEL